MPAVENIEVGGWTAGQAVEVQVESNSWVDGSIVEYDEDAGLVCVSIEGETQYICEEEGGIRSKSSLNTIEIIGERVSADATGIIDAQKPPTPPINSHACEPVGSDPDSPEVTPSPKNSSTGDDVEEADEPIVEGVGEGIHAKNYDTLPWTIVYGNLKYQTLREPDETATCKHAVSMKAHTTGTVIAEAWMKPTKKKFWSTRDAGHCFTYKAGCDQVVKGWDKGCDGMRVGEIRRIHVPSNLAYGSKGNKEYEIPPNNDLIFEVECTYVRRFA